MPLPFTKKKKWSSKIMYDDKQAGVSWGPDPEQAGVKSTTARL